MEKSVYLGFLRIFLNGPKTKKIEFQGNLYSKNVINEIKEIKNNKETIYLFSYETINGFDGFKVDDLIHSFYGGIEIIIAVYFCNSIRDKKDCTSLSVKETADYIEELKFYRKTITECLDTIKSVIDNRIFKEEN